MRITRKRQGPIVETQMVSLADIAFLIIFFFLLTSTFMTADQGVTLPTLRRTDDTRADVSVAMDKNGKIFLDGAEVGGPEALERELKGKLADRKGSKDSEVRFRCDRNLKYAQYKPVYEAISHAGGVIAIMHDLPR